MSDGYEYSFIITGPLDVEESFPNRAILKGTFIRLNVPTGNGRIYQIEEGQQIATGLMGMPVYFGMTKAGKHIKDQPVGRVIKSVYNTIKKVIDGAIEVWNTFEFPDLAQRVRKGWGFSIGGKVKRFDPLGKFNKLLMPIMNAIGMKPNHLQLLEPRMSRADAGAVATEAIPVEETMQVDPCPPWGVCEISEESLSGEATTGTGVDVSLPSEEVPASTDTIEPKIEEVKPIEEESVKKPKQIITTTEEYYVHIKGDVAGVRIVEE